jgi:DNA-binding HxlR family transcriptional regulator
LFSLKEKPYRHAQLCRHLGSVPQRMLTRTLRNLESTGLIARHVRSLRGIAVEYFLDATGKNTHPSTQRYVPLGEATPRAPER